MNVWKLYTDGAYRVQLNRGSWGAFMVSSERIAYTTYGSQTNTTSNRMELTGVIEGYRFLKKQCPEASYIRIYTDSQYIYLGVTQYLHQWMGHQKWQTRARKPVKNYDLWQEILYIIQSHDQISWRWIRREENIKAHLIAEQGLRL